MVAFSTSKSNFGFVVGVDNLWECEKWSNLSWYALKSHYVEGIQGGHKGISS